VSFPGEELKYFSYPLKKQGQAIEGCLVKLDITFNFGISTQKSRKFEFIRHYEIFYAKNIQRNDTLCFILRYNFRFCIE